jgi:hypothetical protein
MVKIQDGAGHGYEAQVDQTNRLLVRAVTETEVQDAVQTGDGYNVNTGPLSISTDSALIYLKNTGTRELVIEALAVGLGVGSASDIARVTLIRNPTAGNIVTGASGVSMNQNRNFGTNQTLQADVYKGGNAATFTDGDDIALFFQPLNGRLFADINFQLEPGNSVGINLVPNLSSGSVLCYAAFVLYEKPETP